MEETKKDRLKSLVVFADVDGTILDLDTYEAGPARQALRTCAALGLAVVFVSSKTRQELEKLRIFLGNRDPFACENGGALYLPRSDWQRPENAKPWGPYWRIVLGRPRSELVAALRNAAARTGVFVRAFHEMGTEELAEVTGLTPAEARGAQEREFDEPFLVPVEDARAVLRLVKELEGRGYGYSRGGRFHHVSGKHDKGDAARILRRLFRMRRPCARFAAFGDAEADLPMLREADYPYLVRRPDGGVGVSDRFPGLRVTRAAGPRGFVEGLGELLRLYGCALDRTFSSLDGSP